MDARTIESSLQLSNLTDSEAADRFSNLPQPELNDGLGAIRGLFHAFVFQGVIGVILFAGWGLWRMLR